MELLSSAFENGAWIPRIHTGEGEDLSPPLQWRDAPEGTVTYALIVDDPDAAAGLWIHWVLYDIPASISALPQGLERVDVLAHGARKGCCLGVDRFTRRSYHGPQPPAGAAAPLPLPAQRSGYPA